MTTDKEKLRQMLRKEEDELRDRVIKNYKDAKKHLRRATRSDDMAQDVLYLAARTFCNVYEMLDDLDGVENKLLNGEIEQIANGELSIGDFFAQQLNKKRVRKASDNFFEELKNVEKEKELSVSLEKDPLVDYFTKKDNEECVCDVCHPEKIEKALKKMGVDIHDKSVSISESFVDRNEKGIRFQAEIKHIDKMTDTPNILYVDVWQGPAWDGEDLTDEVKEFIKDIHPGVAVLIKKVKEKLW